MQLEALHKVGRSETYVASIFHQIIAAEGLCTAYDSIVTVDGHILHNHHYHNILKDGQSFWLDGGAEARSGYATDVTRTWPVNGVFHPQQRRAYDAVLQAQKESIAQLKTGVRYRDVHMTSCRVLAEFLKEEKIVNCGVEEILENGTHVLFFHDGVGYLIGLDVHDYGAFWRHSNISKWTKTLSTIWNWIPAIGCGFASQHGCYHRARILHHSCHSSK